METDKVIDIYTERFTVTLSMATALHLMALVGVGFVLPKAAKLPNTGMEVILVQTESEQVSTDADYLAQANQQGSGNSLQKERPTTPTLAPFPDVSSEEVITPLPQPSQVATSPQTQSFETLTTPVSNEEMVNSSAETVVAEEPSDAEVGPQSPINNIAEILENTLMVDAHLAKYASLQAELDAKFNSYAKRLRSKHIYASTRENKYALYMENWRKRVEEIGNKNYPDKAREKKLTGNIILDVAVNANGTIREVTIVKPSKHKILDEAALRIVRLAAPFEPFPEKIRKETDVLHITRTWEFRYNSLSSRR
jgi:protein TonB